MTKLLRTAILISVIPALAFARGGGGHGGGGGARSGGGGMRSGGGSAVRSAGFSGGSVARGGNVITRGGGVGGTPFRGNTFVRGGGYGYGNRFYGGRYYYPSFYGGFGFGFGYGYPYYYPYSSYYPYAYDPYYYGAPYYDNGYYDNGYYNGNAGYVQAPPTQTAPPTVINQNIGTPSAGTAPGSFYRAADYYLIAFNDHTIRAALSYTVEGDQLRYTTREHEEKTAPLSSVDVRFSEQINRDRRVEFRLP